MGQTITIIFRASDQRFGVHAKDRFFSKSKTEVTKTCFKSLFNSFKKYKHRTKFIIVGDRLSPDLQNFFKDYKLPVESYTGGGKTGLRDNINKTLDIAYTVGTDWVWIQEDDYLFVEDAGEKIFDLIDNKEKITKNTNKDLVIYPADYSDRYTRHKDGNGKYQLFLGNKNYWREVHNTTFSWCISRDHLNRIKPLFNQMFDEIRFKTFDTFLSDKIWTQEALVVSPLPSLSVHLDSHIRLPPCIDWENIWKQNVNM